MATTFEDAKKVKVNIAVVGETGVGKSSFVNYFRDIKYKKSLPEHASSFFAKESSSFEECTKDLRGYPFKGNKNLKMWDIPGANSTAFRLPTYHKDTKMQLYDAFIMLLEERFTNTDLEILKHIQTTGKPYYFARTKMDRNMKDKLEELSEETEEEKIKELNDHANHYRQSFCDVFQQYGLDEPKKIYLVGKKSLNHWTSDNDKLKNQILADLPDLQKAAFGLALWPKTNDEVDVAVKVLQKAIYGATITASLGGLIPIPGVSVALNIPIMGANVFHQMKKLGLGDSALEIRTLGYKEKTWKKKDFLEEVKKQLHQEDPLVSAWMPSIFARTAAEITSALTSTLALLPSLLAANVVAEATYAFPIVGSILNSGTAGSTTYYVLHKILEANRKIAKSIIKVLEANESTA